MKGNIKLYVPFAKAPTKVKEFALTGKEDWAAFVPARIDFRNRASLVDKELYAGWEVHDLKAGHLLVVHSR